MQNHEKKDNSHGLRNGNFFGLCCKGGMKYSQVMSKNLHVSIAALDPASNSTTLDCRNSFDYAMMDKFYRREGGVSVMVECDDCQYLLCSFSPDYALQFKLDLNFAKGQKVSFFLKGKGPVHLSGYYIDENNAGVTETEHQPIWKSQPISSGLEKSSKGGNNPALGMYNYGGAQNSSHPINSPYNLLPLNYESASMPSPAAATNSQVELETAERLMKFLEARKKVREATSKLYDGNNPALGMYNYGGAQNSSHPINSRYNLLPCGMTSPLNYFPESASMPSPAAATNSHVELRQILRAELEQKLRVEHIMAEAPWHQKVLEAHKKVSEATSKLYDGNNPALGMYNYGGTQNNMPSPAAATNSQVELERAGRFMTAEKFLEAQKKVIEASSKPYDGNNPNLYMFLGGAQNSSHHFNHLNSHLNLHSSGPVAATSLQAMAEAELVVAKEKLIAAHAKVIAAAESSIHKE